MVGNPCPIVSIEPEVDAIEILGKNNWFGWAECYPGVVVRGTIDKLSDIVAPKLLLAGAGERGLAGVRLDRPPVKVLEIDRGRSWGFGAPGPVHFVGSPADWFLGLGPEGC